MAYIFILYFSSNTSAVVAEVNLNSLYFAEYEPEVHVCDYITKCCRTELVFPPSVNFLFIQAHNSFVSHTFFLF